MPNTMLGGKEKFKELMQEAKQCNVKIIIDCLARVSSSRPHKKYKELFLYSLDDDGKKVYDFIYIGNK